MMYLATLVAVFLALVLVEAEVNENFNWERPVDLYLESKMREIVEENNQVEPLDDIVEDFSKKVAFWNLKGRFVARQGTLRDISTLRRRAGVVAEKKGKVTKLSTTLGWDVLIVKFDYYRLNMLWYLVTGSIEGNIKLNSVEITLAFEDADGECATTLDRLKIVEFDDFELKVTGLGPLNHLASSIVRIVAEKHRTIIIDKTERRLKEYMRIKLEDYNCEEHASLYGVPLN